MRSIVRAIGRSEINKLRAQQRELITERAHAIAYQQGMSNAMMQQILLNQQQILQQTAGGSSTDVDGDTEVDDNWTEHFDSVSGRNFYVHKVSGISTWEKPLPIKKVEPVPAVVTPPPPAPQALTPTPAVVMDILPEGWTSTLDPTSGRTFYHNTTTGVSQWDKPTTTLLPPPPPAAPPAPAVIAPPPPSSLPTGWTEAVDPASGRVFYHHAATGTTQWDKPTATATAAVPAPPPAPPAAVNPWTTQIDPASGKTYYFNTVSGASSWTLPT